MDDFKTFLENSDQNKSSIDEVAAAFDMNITPVRMSELIILTGTLIQGAIANKNISSDELRFIAYLLKGASDLYYPKK